MHVDEVVARRFGPVDGVPLVALPGLNDGLAPLWLAPPAAPPDRFAADPVLVLSYPRDLPAQPTTEGLALVFGEYLERHAGPCVVSGHSMGAMVALHLAADRPDLVVGLVLGAAVARTDDQARAVLGRWEDLLTSGCFSAFHRDAIEVAYTDEARMARLALLDAGPVPEPDRGLVERHLRLSHAARTHDATSRLATVVAPALVLAGQHDPLTAAERSRELAAALPDARFGLLDGVSHGFPEQAADRYTSLLDDFIHRELAVAGRT